MRFTKILLSTLLLTNLFAFAQAPANTATPAVDVKASKVTVYVYR